MAAVSSETVMAFKQILVNGIRFSQKARIITNNPCNGEMIDISWPIGHGSRIGFWTDAKVFQKFSKCNDRKLSNIRNVELFLVFHGKMPVCNWQLEDA